MSHTLGPYVFLAEGQDDYITVRVRTTVRFMVLISKEHVCTMQMS